MLIFGAYEGQRLTLEVPVGMTVNGLKEMIKHRLGISVDLYKQDKKVLVLSYAGSDMNDDWVFSDLGIVPGTTIRVQLKEEVKPVLYIRCSHSQDTISLYDNITIAHMRLNEVRSIASAKSGLPVGIFRLTTTEGQEMFDQHRLEDYGVDVGHSINLENWDGWNEFLNLAIMGFTPQVISQLSSEEMVGRYQMKVAMFIAAHFGHVDLARAMLRQGIRSDDPIGYHPSRAWCRKQGHIEALNCPVHEATLRGQLGVLRLFVNHDITCLKAKDGNGLEPLNIALRRRVKHCASFLLTKQWTKVNITRNFALHLPTYTKLKKWCDRAKERTLLKYGQSKTSLRRRNFQSGPLISHGVLLDGFSQSPMTGKPKAVLQREEKEERDRQKQRSKFTVSVAEICGSTEEPETYFKAVSAAQTVRPGRHAGTTRWGKLMSTRSRASLFTEDTPRDAPDGRKTVILKPGGGDPDSNRLAEEHESSDGVTRLPPILQRMRVRLTSQSSISQPVDETSTVPRGDTKGEKSTADGGKGPISRLVKNKGAFFMTTTGTTSQPGPTTGQSRSSLSLPLGQTTVTSHPPPPSERSDKSKLETSLSVVSETKPFTAFSVTSTESHGPEDGDNDKKQTVGGGRSKKRRNRVSSALLLSKAKSSEGSIPLPLLSTEHDRRPFFYHQGHREDELVESTLDLLSKYKEQTTSRERAIKSLSVANTFKDKPWLGQVRLALALTSNALKRNVRRLRQGPRRVRPRDLQDLGNLRHEEQPISPASEKA